MDKNKCYFRFAGRDYGSLKFFKWISELSKLISYISTLSTHFLFFKLYMQL